METRTFCKLGLEDTAGFIDSNMKHSISSSESLTLLPFVFSMEASQHGLLLSFNQTQTLNLTCEDDDAAIDGSKRSAVMIMSKQNELKKMKSTVDHIVAERRRREKLSQRFIALTAIVPGLKKMDKASVLGEAIEHIKDLKERVKILEDNIKKKSTSSCGKCDYECPISSIENDTTVHNGSASDHKYYLHDIDVKLCENAVLVKIHCENQKGVLASLVSDIEALQFTIKNFSTVHFLGSLLDITLVAQVEEDCTITMEDAAKKLNFYLRNALQMME